MSTVTMVVIVMITMKTMMVRTTLADLVLPSRSRTTVFNLYLRQLSIMLLTAQHGLEDCIAGTVNGLTAILP